MHRFLNRLHLETEHGFLYKYRLYFMIVMDLLALPMNKNSYE